MTMPIVWIRVDVVIETNHGYGSTVNTVCDEQFHDPSKTLKKKILAP